MYQTHSSHRNRLSVLLVRETSRMMSVTLVAVTTDAPTLSAMSGAMNTTAA